MCQGPRTPTASCVCTTSSGEAYDAADPELLGWVHLALVDSLAEAVRRYGITRFDHDRYLAETSRVGDHLDAAHVPRSVAGLLGASYAHYLPRLARTSTDGRRRTPSCWTRRCRCAIRAPYRVVAAAAAASLPPALRGLLGPPARSCPTSPPACLGRPATSALLAAVLGPSPAAAAAARRTTRAPAPPPPPEMIT